MSRNLRILAILGSLGLAGAWASEASAQWPGDPGWYGGRYKVKVRGRGFYGPVVMPAPVIVSRPPIIEETTFYRPAPLVETRYIQPAPVVERRVIQPPPIVETRVIRPAPVVERRVIESAPVAETRYFEPPY